MKKVLLISGIGGTGLVAAGTGIGISASSSSPSTEKTRENTLNLDIFSSPKENENLSESTKYKPFEEVLKEIEKIVENSNIFQKLEKLKEIIDKFEKSLLGELEGKIYDLKAKLGKKSEANEKLLTDLLTYVGEKDADYKKTTKNED